MESNFETKVSIYSEYGKYGWCGNNYDGEKSGYYFTRTSRSQQKTKRMVLIDIEMNVELLYSIDTIEIYDCNGYLVQYSSTRKLNLKNRFFFSLNDDIPDGSNLIIKYQKFLPQSEEDRKMLRRAHSNTIYQDNITIPKLEIKASKECAICLEQVDDDIYISKCKHVFHNACLWEYLEKNKYLKPLHSLCIRACEHSEKTSPFPCPICQTTLEQ